MSAHPVSPYLIRIAYRAALIHCQLYMKPTVICWQIGASGFQWQIIWGLSSLSFNPFNHSFLWRSDKSGYFFSSQSSPQACSAISSPLPSSYRQRQYRNGCPDLLTWPTNYSLFYTFMRGNVAEYHDLWICLWGLYESFANLSSQSVLDKNTLAIWQRLKTVINCSR